MKIRFFTLLLAMLFLPVCALAAQDAANRVVVAADGSGDYYTVGEALRKVRGDLDTPFTIFIKNGVYREKLLINATANNIIIEGENPDSCIITWDDYAALRNMGTSGSYTFKVEGNNITFRNLTIENAAGQVGQAVAMHTIGDCISFINCRFLGNQDTIYTAGNRSRLLFDNCYIEGTTDFIFGPATALFTGCEIHSKSNSYITAASTPADVEVGYVFSRCRLTADEGVDKVYLGRPWRPYSSTTFIDCEMGSHITPAGWHNWKDPENEKTARYGEYGSKGPGASAGRVEWARTIDAATASRLVDPAYIYNNVADWNPDTSKFKKTNTTK